MTEPLTNTDASAFVDRLSYVEDSYSRLLFLSAIWAGAMVLAIGWQAALSWFALIVCAVTLPKVPTFDAMLRANPTGIRSQVLSVVTAMIWGVAPFLVWTVGDGQHNSLAVMMVGIGFLLVLNKYRGAPRPAIVAAAPYMMLCAYFLYESRLSPSFIIVLFGVFAYFAALAGFLYTGKKARAALVALKQEQDQLIAGLKRDSDKAERANTSKSSFLANMSHELRTPLNGILGLSGVLVSDLKNPHHRRKAELIQDSGQNLLALLNDILDISKMEAGAVTVEEVEFDLLDGFRKAFQFWKPMADQKHISLVFRKQKDLPQYVVSDPTRIRQCVNNLVNNALKFTPRNGEVTVTATGRAQNGRYSLNIAVEDTGVGISEENLENLFQPFSQADESTNRKFGGTGLGLVITRQLCQMLDGDVVVESVLGEGTKFTMSIYVDQASAPPVNQAVLIMDEADLPTLSGKKCLVVEDNEINREVLLLLLQPYDVSVVIAHNGQEAYDTLRVQHFDFVLMDLQMPVMGGLEATRKIRQSKTPFASIPIIAMTANAMIDDRDKCLAAGMDEYVSKPLGREKLVQAIDLALSQRVDFDAIEKARRQALA